MPGITTCTKCGTLYEEDSEEHANEPGRLCLACWYDDKKRRLREESNASMTAFSESLFRHVADP